MQKTSQWLLSFKTRKNRNSLDLTPHKICRKISITGGKGGVGKTSVALRLASDLGSMGYKVLLVDCDTNLSNTAIKLGLPVDDNFWKLLAGEKTFSEIVVKKEKFDLLPSCNGSLDLFESKLSLDEVIIDIISSHETEYDYILLDSPAGLARETVTLNAYCDDRVIVVTPDKSSITDSYSMMKILSQRFGVRENHLLVNMYQNEKQFQKVVMTLSETVENFLSSRTVILGGLRKLDVTSENYDTFFLSQDDSEWSKNCLKISSAFTENEGVLPLPTEVSKEQHLGQDVH